MKLAELRADVDAMLGGTWSATVTYQGGSLRDIESTELHHDGANIGVASDMRGDDAQGIVVLRNHVNALLDLVAAVDDVLARFSPDALSTLRRARAALEEIP
jgi:hypothetical protein